MNPIINPSNSAGHSFKGLHAYCAHDKERAQTSERVDWMATRNIGTDDPNQAWKIMIATAAAQNELKRGAGIRAGQPPKDGAVMHVVLALAEGEPTDQKSMEAAADEFLSYIGADPAKMRSKNKPSRRQFADEHQVIMYAHNDTGKTHLHLMVNRIHPEHGLVLPSNNDQIKAQNWALDYSKRQGTDHLTPAREENHEMRKNGEYVKANRRKSRNIYEQEQAVRKAASNDNDRMQIVRVEQSKKDAALALRGRNMAKLHAAALDKLIDGHKQRKASIANQLKKQVSKTKAAIREEFRPKFRELKRTQASERKTFDELERSFFGKASNVFRTVRLTTADIGNDRTGVISRSFRIISNSGARKEYFEQAQKRQISALEGDQAKVLQSRVEALKSSHGEKYAQNRAVFAEKRDEMKTAHSIERDQLKSDWKERTVERKAAFETLNDRNLTPDSMEAQIDRVLSRIDLMQSFGGAEQEPSAEQDNTHNRSDDQKR